MYQPCDLTFFSYIIACRINGYILIWFHQEMSSVLTRCLATVATENLVRGLPRGSRPNWNIKKYFLIAHLERKLLYSLYCWFTFLLICIYIFLL